MNQDEKKLFEEFQVETNKVMRLIEEVRKANSINYHVMMASAGKYIAWVSSSCEIDPQTFRANFEMLIKDYEIHYDSIT